MAEAENTELVVVAGLDRSAVETTVAGLLERDPGLVVLHHDLRDLHRGRVRRRLRTGATDGHSVLELAHGCISCTIREDVLPTVARLAGRVPRIMLHLDPGLEPEPVCWALDAVRAEPGGPTVTDLVSLRGVLTVLEPLRWLEDATGDDTLPERGLPTLPDDERTVAQIAVGQAEFADVLVTVGAGPDPDAWALARASAVLDRLAPLARRVRQPALEPADVFDAELPAEARRGIPGGVHDPLLRGAPPLDADAGVRTLVFADRRPFHPDRLHDALDHLLDGVVRSRGRIWLATRPDAVLWLESAGGGLRIGHAGEWLAGRDAAAWEGVDARRRALAALAWDPRWGDRAQDVVVLCHRADPDDVEEALRDALLTDAELAGGERSWSAMHDPFGFVHDEPCADPQPARTDRDGGTGEGGG